MRLKQAFEDAVRFCEENDVPSPRMNAELLLRFTLGVDRAHLFAYPERELTADEIARYEAALHERARGVPAQYITGHQEFWGLDLIVNPSVLIPRPETEHVIEAFAELVPPDRSCRVVDVGSGSGCIALAIAHDYPRCDVTAVDLSPAALEVARLNAARLELDRIRFLQSDLLSAVANEQFDFVLSNPPYVGEGEADRVQREVRKFEPHMAVFGGPEGFDTIRRLIPQAFAVLRPGGYLLMEIGYSQSDAVRALLDGWDNVYFEEDLQGIPRVAVARKAEKSDTDHPD